MPKRSLYWGNLSDQELMQLRFCDLGLEFKGSPIQKWINKLYRELREKKLRFKPHVWISSEWFCPYGITGFAVPFYLFHPRLMALEKKMMGEVEGHTEKWCMKLLRHECGHAIDNAFLLRLSKERQKLFGLSGTAYPKFYTPEPNSRHFVKNLKNNYAQAHPDEDWAESFAVWLSPDKNWRNIYTNNTARRKLDLVEKLLQKISSKSQLVFNTDEVDEISSLNQSLGEHYREKRRRYGLSKTFMLKKSAETILQKLKSEAKIEAGAEFLYQNKKQLCRELSCLTKQNNYIINNAYTETIKACNARGIYIKNVPKQSMSSLLKALSIQVSAFIEQKRHRIFM